ncbi:MAG: DUF222 domain-containing protein [Ilumatobacteraceae bacterium]
MAGHAAPELAEVLDALEHVAEQLAVVDVTGLSRDDLSTGTLRMAGLLDRLTAGQARLVAEADRATVWASSGARNMAGWLADQTRSSFGRAIEMVRLADTLGSNSLLADKVAAGAVSTATAVALHDAILAPPPGAGSDDVDALVELCTGAGPRDAKSAAEMWVAHHQTVSEDELEARRHRRRSVRFSAPTDGLITMTAVLPTLAAGSVRKALCSIARLQPGDAPGTGDDRSSEQRLADALVQMAAATCRGELPGREAPTLLVTIDLDSLEGRDDRAGVTEFGDCVAASTVRRLVDDATIRTIVHRGPQVVGVGRDRRLASRAQYSALVARDGRCRWPGCHIPASWCEVDHLVPWQSGGCTDLDNLVLWCSHHHHRKHAPGVEVLGDAHHLRLRLDNGTVIDCPAHGAAATSGGDPPRVRRRTTAAA